MKGNARPAASEKPQNNRVHPKSLKVLTHAQTPVLCVLQSLLEGWLQRKACFMQSALDDVVTDEGMSIFMVRTTIFVSTALL